MCDLGSKASHSTSRSLIRLRPHPCSVLPVPILFLQLSAPLQVFPEENILTESFAPEALSQA